MTVSETERLIDAKVEEGHPLDDIVAGVQRFQKYCADTGKPSRIKPAAFVHGEKWRDDWKLHRVEPKAKKPKARQSKVAKSKQTRLTVKPKYKRNPWVYNPPGLQWESKLRNQIGLLLKRHPNDFPNGTASTDVECARMIELLRPWHSENPEPCAFINKVTGETWGIHTDQTPAADWSPNTQNIP